ncbi:hypothetical protein RUM44_003131 [Polyplax serrata]|uniref:Uncharacterized protein n=1 Tax=Polyplax serrata TaxID=468196 RepID=A0ABR1AXM4_POLSC
MSWEAPASGDSILTQPAKAQKKDRTDRNEPFLKLQFLKPPTLGIKNYIMESILTWKNSVSPNVA